MPGTAVIVLLTPFPQYHTLPRSAVSPLSCSPRAYSKLVSPPLIILYSFVKFSLSQIVKCPIQITPLTGFLPPPNSLHFLLPLPLLTSLYSSFLCFETGSCCRVQASLEFAVWLTLALTFCLSVPSARITDVCHPTWLGLFFYIHFKGLVGETRHCVC